MGVKQVALGAAAALWNGTARNTSARTVIDDARVFEDYLSEPEGDSTSTAAAGMARLRQQVYDLIQQDIVELENLVPESVEDGQYRDGEIAGLKKAADHLVAAEAS